MKMTNGSQESPVLFHLNSEIYKNGLKFDRDRTFRNRLILKTIILMAVLLIIATVSFVSMANSKTVRNHTDFQIKREGLLPDNSDPRDSGKYEEDLNEFQTTFAPPRMPYTSSSRIPNGYSLPRKTVKARRRRTLNSITGFHSETLERSSHVPSENAAIADQEKSSRISDGTPGSNAETMRNAKNPDVYYLSRDKLAEKVKQSAEQQDHSESVKEISSFWTMEKDLESIRSSQAKRMLSYMDLTADPCNDFYQYACGNWNKNNPIPQDKAGFDIFELLRESLDVVLRDLLAEPSDNNISEAAIKAKEYYESCMNEDILEKRGNEPLFNLSRSLKGWPIIDSDWNASDFDWIDVSARLKLYSHDVLIRLWIGPDMKNSSENILQFDQTVLGLPSKDYFLRPPYKAYLEAYKKYLITVAVLLGAENGNATKDAEEIIDFEKQLAKITLGQEERRNMSELYVKMSLSELSEHIPRIDWAKYLTIVLGRKVEANESVVTYALKYFKALVPLIEKTEKRIVCNYLMWRFIRNIVNSLDRKFHDARQEFFYALSGREKSPQRWTYCVAQVNAMLGMALGSIFVQRYFDETSKNDTVSMTHDIMHSFRDMLNKTDWIDPETKALALDKINAMTLRIGYPDFILDKNELDNRYKNLTISKTEFFENTLTILQQATKLEQEKLGKVVNKSQWNTPPATVNAYYSRNINQIIVPAGILQPPFYHKYFPKSLNFGGIGAAIGHEITHGFDDKGRLFDQNGNYHKWWKEETIVNFHRRARCLINQYSGYTVREIDMNIDGVNTQGENIADNGGIRQAFRAYERWFTENEPSDETMPGINATNFQLFFLNFAQIWCGGMRPEASRNKLKTAQHSPGRFRVIGTLSNSEEFARVFSCPSDTTMNPSNKCSLW